MASALFFSFTCLGLADFQSHYGSMTVSIVWKMKELPLGFVMRKTVKFKFLRFNNFRFHGSILFLPCLYDKVRLHGVHNVIKPRMRFK